MSLCVYGPKIGYSSLEVVTRGMIEAGIEHGVFSGHVPTGRSYDDHDLYRGRDASCAVLCGGYPEMPILEYGVHRYRSFMLAANSTWVPDAFWAHSRSQLTEILTPSEWSKQQIESARPSSVGLPVRVVPHGVLAGFKPVEPGESPKVNVCGPPGKFVVTHFAGSSDERKGSLELVKAFMAWPKRDDAFLFLCMNSMQVHVFTMKVLDLFGEEAQKHMAIVPQLNAEPETMRWVYAASDLVCQPSRAEGFGLVPLEALCCGTPIAATKSTGHLQWMLGARGEVGAGIVPIEVEAPRKIDYDPGGMAPHVSVDAIAAALDFAFTHIEVLRREAMEFASDRRSCWSWANQTRAWVSQLKERYVSDG